MTAVDHSAEEPGDAAGRAPATPATSSDVIDRSRSDRRDRVEWVARAGWLAKGIVYLLFGVAASAIAMRGASSGRGDGQQASPKGALTTVVDAPAGRLLLAVLGVGLALYCAWRVASTMLVDGDDAGAWAHRLGYGASAAFYAVLCFVAFRSVITGADPGRSSSVEAVSSALLEQPLGRLAVGIGGIATMGVGCYFVVQKAARRSFVDDLDGVDADADDNVGADHVLWFTGIAGWIGRGVVTVLVGWFVLMSAIRFDPDEARGFDRALREATTSTPGSVLVWIGAAGLIAYGIFCAVSFSRRSLHDD